MTPGHPDIFHGSNCQKLRLSFFLLNKNDDDFDHLNLICIDNTVLPKYLPKSNIIVNVSNMGQILHYIIHLKQDIYRWISIEFCHCSVFSCRNWHKESSCQAANLYSCEGHIRRHGMQHKSEISLVISCSHCALMSTGDCSGLFWAFGELKYLHIKGQKCTILASHIDSAGCLSAYVK